MSTESLNLPVDSLSIIQNFKTTQNLVVNNSDLKIYFAINCLQNDRYLEVSNDAGASWSKLLDFSCLNNSSELIYQLSDTEKLVPELSWKLRRVGDNGTSPEVSILVLQLQSDPLQQSVVIDTGTGFTQLASPPLTLTSRFKTLAGTEIDAAQVYLTNVAGCSAGGQWEDFSTTKTFLLSQLNSTNDVYAKFKDAGGNETACIHSQVLHDSVPPTLLNLSINDSDNSINTNTLNISMTVSGSPVQMKISDTSNCSSGNFQVFQANVFGWNVPHQNSSNSLSVVLKDSAGNLSSCVTLQYTHDDIIPIPASLNLLAGSSPSNNSNPYFLISGASLGDTVKIYSDSFCTGLLTTQISAGGPLYFTTSFNADGVFHFYIIESDLAGNQTGCMDTLFSYTFDTVAPQSQGSGHPVTSYHSLTNWDEAVNVTDGNWYRWKIGVAASTDCNVNTNYSVWVSKDIFSSIDISGLVDGRVNLCLQAKDLAGNIQSPATTYSWIKNTVPVVATIDSGTPNTDSNLTSLNIHVGGNNIVSYKYKMGATSTTQCHQASGYSSSWIPVSINIIDNIGSFLDGAMTLCLIGKNQVEVPQEVSDATMMSWTKDTVSPSVTGLGHPIVTVSNTTSWTESFSTTDGAVEVQYKIGIASTTDCSLSVGYSSWSGINSSVAMDISALSDDVIRLCVRGKDLAQNIQNLPSEYSWTKNTSGVLAELSGVPQSPSNQTTLNISVTGFDVVSYSYKIGSGSIDCTNATGYSSFVSSATGITSNISNGTTYPDGTIKLCVIGKNSANVVQPMSQPTIVTWTKDTLGPAVIAVTPPSAGTYFVGEDLFYTVEFNEDIQYFQNSTISSMAIYIGGTTRTAYFYKQMSPRKLVYSYNLLATDSGSFGYPASLIIPTTNSTVKDIAGNIISNSTVVSVGAVPGGSVVSTSPKIGFSSEDFSISENQGYGNVDLTVTNPPSIPLVVNYRIQSESAVNGVDYNFPNSGSFTIPANTANYQLQIPIVQNSASYTSRRLIIDLVRVDHGYIDPSMKISSLMIRDIDSTGYSDSNTDPAVEVITLQSALCFRTQHGYVYCVGKATNGQLGNGSLTRNQLLPEKVPGVSGVTALYEINNSTVYAVTSGGVYAWGYNSNGELGNSTTISSGTPQLITNLSGSATKIPTNKRTNFYMYPCFQDGAQVKCWGTNRYFGNGPSLSTLGIPTAIANLAGVKKLFIRSSGTCGLWGDSPTATLKCWGNEYGGGTGVSGTPFEVSSANVVDFDSESATSCFVYGIEGSSSGSIKCWSSGNSYGQLGNGTLTASNLPVSVNSITQATKVFVDFDGNSVCSLGDFDTLPENGNEFACWGYNYYGTVGNGTNTSPITEPAINLNFHNLTDIAVYSNSDTCIKNGNNDLFCWGNSLGAGARQPGLALATGVTEFIYNTNANSAFAISNNGLVCKYNCSSYTSVLPISGIEKIYYVQGSLSFCSLSNTGKVECFYNNSNYNNFGMASAAPTTMSEVFSSGINRITGNNYTFCMDQGDPNLSCYSTNGTSYENKLSINLSYSTMMSSNYSSTDTLFNNGSSTSNSGCWFDVESNLFCNDGANKKIGFGKDVKDIRRTTQTNSNYYLRNGDLYSFTSLISTSAIMDLSDQYLQISSPGGYHFCGVTTQNKVNCWINRTISTAYSSGQLGNNSIGTGPAVNTPVQVLKSTTPGDLLGDVIKVGTYSVVSCALDINKQFWCWGNGYTPYAQNIAANVDDFQMSTAQICLKMGTEWKCGTGTTFNSVISDVDELLMMSSAVLARKGNKLFEKGISPFALGNYLNWSPVRTVW